MRRLLGWISVTGGLILVIVVGFTLYSHFLVDYSLESLEIALSATDKKPAESSTSAYGTKVYQKLIEGMAIEEATQKEADLKNMALLELASRSFDETTTRAGRERAKLYLSQTVEAKRPGRAEWLKILDHLYRLIRDLYYKTAQFFKYVQKNFTKKEQQPVEVSSYLLLTQAEDKEKKWDLDAAADLYRRFLKFYPDHPENSFVALNLSHILIKQKKYHEAERLLRGLAMGNAGMEEYELASNLLKKIEDLKKRDVEIAQLENLLATQGEGPEADKIRLQLGLQYLHSYSLQRAQEIFKLLENAPDEKIRLKARFYLGWIYKLQAQYDQGASVLLKLSEEGDLGEEMGLSLDAQLADIYYQKNDSQKALSYYEKISSKAPAQDQKSAQKASREAWAALADSEQAVIYYFDLKDAEKGAEHLRRAGSNLSAYGDVTDLKSAFKNASEVDLRDMGFYQLKDGKVYEALELFKKKVTQDPKDAWAQAGLATTYVLLTDLYSAREHASLGYKILPDQFTTGVLAYVVAYQSDYDQAIGLYKNALEKDPSYIPAKFNLAGLYIVKERYQDALDLLDELETTFEGHNNIMRQKILNNIGCARWWLGDKDGARQKFEEALDINSEFKDAKLNLSLMAQNDAPQTSSLGG
ncbi:MAG TPA: tetratricopeptide repeat protein [Verrucomicrobiae bacterium]|nr:tetratricopeptide repeat protein [Verrucomicrobiae bacterium]